MADTTSLLQIPAFKIRPYLRAFDIDTLKGLRAAFQQDVQKTTILEKVIQEKEESAKAPVAPVDPVTREYFGNLRTIELVESIKTQIQTKKSNAEGAFGTVYVLEVDTIGRCYVKIINPTTTKWSERTRAKEEPKFDSQLNSVRREIQINHSLTSQIPDFMSKFLGGYLDYEKTDSSGNMFALQLFEFQPGFTLDKLIKRAHSVKKQINPAVSNKLYDSIQECLTALHDRTGYVHRDIKPDNIWVCTPLSVDDVVNATNGGDLRCILIDFGKTIRTGDSISKTYARESGDPVYVVYMNPDEPNAINIIRESDAGNNTFRATPRENNWALKQIKILPHNKGGLNINNNAGGTRRRRRRSYRRRH